MDDFLQLEEVSYNGNVLKSQLPKLMATQTSKHYAPIIQCFCFTLLRLAEWTIYLNSDFSADSMTIEGIGRKSLFFIRDPYNQDRQLDIPFKTGDHPTFDEVIQLILQYRLKYILDPIVLGDFYASTSSYIDPLLQYHEQWLHSKIRLITTDTGSVGCNFCDQNRDLVDYIISRMTTIDFTKPIEFAHSRDQIVRAFLPISTFDNPHASLISPYVQWLSSLQVYVTLLPTVCPLFSRPNCLGIPSGRYLTSFGQGPLKEDIALQVINQLRYPILQTLSLAETDFQGSILQIYGPSFVITKVPEQDTWVLSLMSADEIVKQEKLGDYSRTKFAPDLDTLIPAEVLAENGLLEYRVEETEVFQYPLVRFDSIDQKIYESLTQNSRYYDTEYLTSKKVADLVNNLLLEYPGMHIYMRPTLTSIDITFTDPEEYLLWNIEDLLQNPSPITGGNCLFEQTRIKQFNKSLSPRSQRYPLYQQLRNPFQYACADLIKITTYEQLVDRVCPNSSHSDSD